MNQSANASTTTAMQSNTISEVKMTQTANQQAHKPSLRSTTSVPMANERKQEDPCTPFVSGDPLLNGGVHSIDADLRGIPPFILKLQQNQPILNLMTCGDVSHGKSTLLAALSGERTGKHSAEQKGNMTIRLGYTACKIWKCLRCAPKLQCYFATHSDLALKGVQCRHCGAKPNASHCAYHRGDSQIILVRHLSFVDVPGHSALMQTMVSATSVADAAILVVDASRPCPGKQTAQHIDAVHALGLLRAHKLIVAQNKVDLVTPSRACQSHEEIRRYLETFGDPKLTQSAPVIPISAQSELNIDALCYAIVRALPKFSARLLPQNRENGEFLCATVIRSFDVNKGRDLATAKDIDGIRGGVLGGAVLRGHFELGQRIEIRPGYLRRRTNSKSMTAALKSLSKMERKMVPRWRAQPIRTTVRSLRYGKHATERAFSGGNVGVETNVDPSLTKADGLCGHVIVDARDPNPPPIFDKFKMSMVFLGKHKQFQCGESIRVNIGSFKMKAEIVRRGVGDYDGVLCVLEAPICARVGDVVGVCRTNRKKEWAFVGGGVIRSVKAMSVATDVQCDKASVGVRASAQSALAGKGKDAESVTVHIRYHQRNGRKGVTTVVGLSQRIKFKPLATRMKRKWSTGVTVFDDSVNGTVIQIQGDRRHEVGLFVVEEGFAEKAHVRVHGY